MKEKEVRLGFIRKILNDKNISSQEELLEELKAVGHGSTQATLSRDLQHLRAHTYYHPVRTGEIYIA